MQSEKELIEKSKTGDSGSFGVLYDKYMPPIYRFILVKVGHKHDAEDLTHQVFLKAWQNIGTYADEGHPFSSWLYKIANNSVIDHYRTKKTDISIEWIPEEKVGSNENDIPSQVDQEINLDKIRIGIMKLEQDQQSVLLMKFVNDLSNTEISEALGKSEGAIRVIQHRALKQLKKNLEDQGIITT